MSEFSGNIITISKETTKRLIKDVKDLIKSPLDNEGIYYKHDETNILKGYAYICGPKDSVYFGGNYFFDFQFPSNYPHSPPKVTFKTTDGETRFHPNMYKNGKMCLSILNTWKGDPWTGCQSIRSILLTIISIMDQVPLLHEPGFTKKHSDTNKYSEIIEFKNMDFSVNKLLTDNMKYCIQPFNEIFKEDIVNQFKKNKEDILNILEKKKSCEPYNIKTGIYSLNIHIDWKKTHRNFLHIKST